MNICIVPARGGSKRVPKKNIRDFHGKPLIIWTLESIVKADIFDYIIVTSDCSEVSQIVKVLSSITFYDRPAYLATDTTTTREVVIHTIKEFTRTNPVPDYVCVVYPTAVLLDHRLIKYGLEKLKSSNADYCFSVKKFCHPIHRALRRDEVGRVKMIDPKFRQTRTQDVEATYHDAGQFYWGKAQAYLNDVDTFSFGISIVVPTWECIDIDTEEDFKMAELIFSSRTSFETT